MGIAGLAVLLAAIPLAWVGGYLMRWQRELQRGFFPRVIAAVERNRPGMVRWYLLVGIGHSAIRGALMALLTAALSLLLITIAGLLPLAGKIAPYTLLAGMLGVGLGATLKLYGGPQFLPWLIGGLTAGIAIVVFI
jgi:mannose/fructose/N-acetylgalactosamine-specific phosphotransferase system component IIC